MTKSKQAKFANIHKTATKPTVNPETIEATEVHAAEVHSANVEEEDDETLIDRMKRDYDKLMAKLGITWTTRKVVSTVISLICSAGVFWVGMQALDTLLLAAMAYTGVGFLTFLIGFLGMLAITVASVSIGNRIFAAAMKFDITNVSAKARSIFNRKEHAHV